MSLDARHNAKSVTPSAAGVWTGGYCSAGTDFSSVLLKVVDAGLAAAVFLVPLILGGRVALGQLVLVLLALTVAGAWCARQSLTPAAVWFRSPVEYLLLGAVALVGVQLVPLPPAVLKVLSPHIFETLPLWSSGGGPGFAEGWSTLSLTPVATRKALIIILAFAMLLLTVVQRTREVADVERLLRWIVFSSIAMAGFALLQYITSNGKFFWFFDHPYTDTKTVAKGSFTNRNHFAQFLALGVGPLIWWVMDGLQSKFSAGSGRSSRAHRSGRGDVTVGLRVVGLAFCAFMVLLSLSRGGAMAMFAAAVICVAVLVRGRLVSRKVLVAVIGMGLFVAAALYIYGLESVANRLDDFGSLEELDKGRVRWELWKADARGIADYPLTGTGLASHHEVSPMYFQNEHTAASTEYTHAENSYVQVPLETGIPGLLLLAAAMGTCVYWCVSTVRQGVSARASVCLAAVAAGLGASFVHSMSDFVWYVPGCMVATVVLAGCAVRLWQLGREGAGKPAAAWEIPRFGWLAALACLTLLGYFMVQDRFKAAGAEPYWHRYLLLSQINSDPDDPERHDALGSMMQQLTAVVRWQPDHARAHSRLAAGYLEMFDRPVDSQINPLGIKHVRDAVLKSRFESAEALSTWLTRAFGRRREHLDAALRHSRRALALCPLQGEAYLFLSSLSFLEGPQSPGISAYVQQALKVRPFDGAVLFAAGQEILCPAGEQQIVPADMEKAFAYWRESFRLGPAHQKRLLELLAGRIHVSHLIEAFQPDLGALKRIKAYYRRANLPEALRIVQEQYVAVAEQRALALTGSEAADLWQELGSVYDKLQMVPQRLRCLRNAVRCDPSCYKARYALGTCLLQLQEFAEAEEHIGWCSQRKPQDRKLRKLLQRTLDGRLRMAGRDEKTDSAGRVY